MNEKLQNAIAATRETAAESKATSDKANIAYRELAALRDQLASLESAVQGAESEHATAEAAIQLGEHADLAATGAALHTARQALSTHAHDLQHRIRAGALVAEKLGERAAETNARHVLVQAELKIAIDEYLTKKIADVRATALMHFEAMTDAGEESYALERLLIEREAPYQGGYPARINRAIPPHDTNINRAREAILAEIAAITSA